MCSHGRFVMLRPCKGYRHTGQSPGMRACREMQAVSMCARFEYLSLKLARSMQLAAAELESITWISKILRYFSISICVCALRGFRVAKPRGRRQNLNPEPKINLNHANLKPQNLWAVVSQEFARFTQEFHSKQSFTFQCRSCPQADFVPVAAAAGWAGVTDEPHRRGVPNGVLCSR